MDVQQHQHLTMHKWCGSATDVKQHQRSKVKTKLTVSYLCTREWPCMALSRAGAAGAAFRLGSALFCTTDAQLCVSDLPLLSGSAQR